MEEIAVSVMKTLSSLNTSGQTSKPFDPIEVMNKAKGNRIGYECSKCNNEGVVYYVKDGYELCRDCECMEVRRCINRIEKSGLKEAFKKCTFDSFTIEQDFQKELKSKAIEYISDCEGKWFFVGGQVGCGKTHICTAIARKLLLSNGKRVKYMKWRDEIDKIKAAANSEEQDKILDVWKKAEVLYIDDLFKTEQGKKPTTADIHNTFKILDNRYEKNEIVTLISSEKNIRELIEIDQAVGSRIFQMSKDYCINIGNDIKKNYRLKDLQNF